MTRADWDKACEERFSWWVNVGEEAVLKKRRLLVGLTRSSIVSEVDRIFPPPDFTVVTSLDEVTGKLSVEMHSIPSYATREEVELAQVYLKFLITQEVELDDVDAPVQKSHDLSVQDLLRKRLHK